MRRITRYGMVAAAVATCLAAPQQAQAQALIDNGTVRLGVAAQGHLNFGGSGVRYLPTGFDGTYPGCRCEGWGAGVVGGVSGRASYDNGGVSNVSVVSFENTGSTARSVVSIGGQLEVEHRYAPSTTPNLYRVDVTITNITDGTLGEGDRPIRYQRAMDWDIGPTEFNEYVTIQGTAGATNVIGANSNGFAVPNLTLTPNPDCATTYTGDFNRAGPCDHGANFLFGFDALTAGSSRTFTIFYGAAGNRADALSALGMVGAEIYSFGECNPAGSTACSANGSPNTFIFGFAGVGGTVVPPPGVVPEPGTVLLTATGLAGILIGVRRRRRAA